MTKLYTVVNDARLKVKALQDVLEAVSAPTNNITWEIVADKSDTILTGTFTHEGFEYEVDVTVHVSGGKAIYDVGVGEFLQGFTTTQHWQVVSYVQEIDNGVTGGGRHE